MGKYSVVLWLGLSLSVSQCLWTVNFISVSHREYSGIFQIISFFCPSVGCSGGNFCSFYCENLAELLEGKFTNFGVGWLLWLSSHGVFNAQTSRHWASSNLSIIVYSFLAWHWFLWQFLLLNLCSDKPWLPVFPCPSLHLGGSGLPCVLPFHGSKKSCWFF